MAKHKFNVLYQGEANTYRTRDPEFVFHRGALVHPPPGVVSLIKGQPGFVVEELEEEENILTPSSSDFKKEKAR
jgi:hypothetical protein